MSGSVLTLPDSQWADGGTTVIEDWVAMWAYPNYIGFERHFQLYRDMVDWIKANVVNYKHNAMWTKIGDCIYINLRNPRDAMMFALRFGSENT